MTAASVADYLRSRGVIDGEATARELAGGISNIVLRVDGPAPGFVVKQALEVLRVQQRWEFDRARIFTERRCMEVLAQLLGPDDVPSVVDHDDEAFAFTMTAAPESGMTWKSELLRGEVRLGVAERVGRLLGQLQARSAGDALIADEFDNLMPLEQGRIEPYHLSAARFHADLEDAIAADIQRLRTNRRVLVLGDYSPKNILVFPSDQVILLDFEVAHWGDPAFDPAFALTHLVLKEVRRPETAPEYRAARHALWNAYEAAGGLASIQDVASEMAVLMLCRVDGKSPAEYLLAEKRAFVRAQSRRLIRTPDKTLADFDDLADRWRLENI
ncbi:phosphotransferase family protein [Microbacterium sp. NPDC058062]|uniref:phosphotransferase family protein n=1 Tax=Microbacterium sp. NPDC058062 TaxID=3346320 RepID=UPI0036DEAC0E